MKNIYHGTNACTFNVILFIFLIFIISCKKEDGEPIQNSVPENSFTYKDVKYPINHTVLRYLGRIDLVEDGKFEDTHFGYMAYFTDGKIISTMPGTSVISNTYLLSFMIATTIDSHSPDFRGGTFNSVSNDDFFGRISLENKSFFATFILSILRNQDNNFTTSWISASNGQVIFMGENDKFQVSFETTTDFDIPEHTIKGNFDGFFELENPFK